MEKDILNEHINRILSALSENPGLELERLYETITGKDYTETYNDFLSVESILKAENLAFENRDAGLFYITPNGLRIVQSGGYLKYKEKLVKEVKLKHEKELLEIEQLKWNKKTRSIAWLALTVSLISLILQIVSVILK